MRSLIVGAILLLSTSAYAADVTVTFTADEYNAMIQFIELGLKQGGLPVALAAVHLAKKLEAAKTAADSLPPPETESE